jgi:hypothetical protein
LIEVRGDDAEIIKEQIAKDPSERPSRCWQVISR